MPEAEDQVPDGSDDGMNDNEDELGETTGRMRSRAERDGEAVQGLAQEELAWRQTTDAPGWNRTMSGLLAVGQCARRGHV